MSSQIFNPDKNEIVKEMPDLPGMYRTYPNTGGSVMLPLLEKNNYEAEIMICGGGDYDDPESPTDDTCGKIRPLDPEPRWDITKMPGGGRSMVEGITLLDGTILWLNGARLGCEGFGTASEPALDAMVYSPATKDWALAGRTDIPRLYHAVALMLLDGTILVAGSNPNEMPILPKDVDLKDPLRAFPTEFRVEEYTPSYLLGKRAHKRPRNIAIDKKVFIPGKTVSSIHFHSADQPKDVKVWLYHGGFVTHALHMGQIMVEMEQVKSVTYHKHGRYEVAIKVPGIKLAPGPYVIYLTVNSVPGHGQFVSVQNK
ncbi:hypothetical protein H2198_005331 [Neophaeococcomyces mojaviensis]|uniref:Uncharacterized protein n=1 Tax=Neophaeococcomyces mojaviensis TaxID=3383035 RepID=A0ACC3A5W9_9EURO|nr:hypothetical protein H2198_005331 [Knufia sp. JES_112]